MSRGTQVTVQTASLPTLLLVLFVGLKLTDHIGWSWLWVIAPVWAPAALVLILFVGIVAAVGVFAGLERLGSRGRAR